MTQPVLIRLKLVQLTERYDVVISHIVQQRLPGQMARTAIKAVLSPPTTS